jgi:uncharacterized membrane protein YhaH (DUF805 family)
MSATRRLRMASLGVISMLIIQFVLGMIENLYGPTPTSAKPVGLFSYGWLAVHFIMGILLLISALVVPIRAFSARNRVVAWTSVLGVVAIIGAIGAGVAFTRNGASGASLGMSIGFAIAISCFVANLIVLGGDSATAVGAGAGQS